MQKRREIPLLKEELVNLSVPGGGMEPQFPGRALADDAVDDTDVEVQMRIQRRAESLDEGDRPEARLRRGARRALA